jgi:hypothetical protein
MTNIDNLISSLPTIPSASEIGIDIPFENDHESFPPSAMIEPEHFRRMQAIFDYNDTGTIFISSSLSV